MEVSRHAEVSQGRISTRRIRICDQKLKIVSVGAEQMDPTKTKNRYNKLFIATLRRFIIVPGGLITSPWVVLVVLVLVFVVRGGGFLVLVDVVACHYVY